MSGDGNGSNGRWRALPWTLIAFLGAQTVGAIVFWANTGFRVDGHDKSIAHMAPIVETIPLIRDHQIINEQRITALEQAARKLDILEERQRVVIQRLDENGRKLDALVEQGQRR